MYFIFLYAKFQYFIMFSCERSLEQSKIKFISLRNKIRKPDHNTKFQSQTTDIFYQELTDYQKV